jgi:tRNA(adenine34) deaminase
MVDHEYYMGLALEQAEAAIEAGEVPVGAVIVRDGLIVAQAHNQRELLGDPTAHAEMIAVTQAAAAIGSWRLERCQLYVTLEPCLMCAGAVIQARIPLVVYGARDAKAGACESLFAVLTDNRLNHRAQLVSGVLAGPCAALLSDFFADQRAKGKK